MIPLNNDAGPLFEREAKRLNAWSEREIPENILIQEGSGIFYIRPSVRFAYLNGVTLTFFYSGKASKLKTIFSKFNDRPDDEIISDIFKVAYVYNKNLGLYRNALDVVDGCDTSKCFVNMTELITCLEENLEIEVRGLTFTPQGEIRGKQGEREYLTLVNVNKTYHRKIGNDSLDFVQRSLRDLKI